MGVLFCNDSWGLSVLYSLSQASVSSRTSFSKCSVGRTLNMAKNFRTTQNDRRLKRRRLTSVREDSGLSAGVWKQCRAGNSLVERYDGLLQKAHDILSMLLQCRDDTRKALCEGYSPFGFASLRDFSPDDRRSQSSFCAVVGRFHKIRMNDERPERLQIAPDIFAESDSLGILQHHSFAQKPLESSADNHHGKLEFLELDQALPVTVPQFQRPFDFELTPRTQAFCTHSPVDQLLEIPLQMAEAELSAIFRNGAVSSPAIRCDNSRERAEQRLQGIATAPRVYSEQRCIRASCHPEPGAPVSTAPSCLVGPGDFRRSHDGFDFLVGQKHRPIHDLLCASDRGCGNICGFADEQFEKLSALPDAQMKSRPQMTQKSRQSRSQKRRAVFGRNVSRCSCVAMRALDRETMYFPDDRFDLRQLDLLSHARIANASSRQGMTATPTGGGSADDKLRHTLRREGLTPVACMALSTTTSIRAPRMNRSGWIRRRGAMTVLGTACQRGLQFLDQRFELCDTRLKLEQFFAVPAFIFHNSIVRIFA